MEVKELLSKKFQVYGRMVEVQDAAFILGLRTDKRLGRFLSYTENDLIAQEQWILSYKDREKLNEEFYFVYENNHGVKYGVSRIYNIDKNSFEIGSWLFALDTPEGVSVLADLASRDFAFETFAFDSCRFEVRKANKNVVNYHRRFNPELIAEDGENYYFRLSKENYYDFRNKLIKMYSYGIE